MPLSATTESSRITSSDPARMRFGDRRFFSGMALLSAATVFAGFAPTYYLRAYTGAPPISPLAHVHGAVFTTWMVFFVIQTALIPAKRTRTHRQVGVYGGVLAIVMTALGIVTAIAAAKRGYNGQSGQDPLVFLVVPVGSMLVFSSLVGASLYYRRQPDTHKRLMLLAVIGGLLEAATARLPLAFAQPAAGIGVYFAFVLAGPVYDRLSRGRVHASYKWTVPLVVLSWPVRVAIGSTAAWHTFASFLTR